jgi:hypothetical protein
VAFPTVLRYRRKSPALNLGTQEFTPIPTEGSALQGRTAAAEQSLVLLIPAYAPLSGGRSQRCRQCWVSGVLCLVDLLLSKALDSSVFPERKAATNSV